MANKKMAPNSLDNILDEVLARRASKNQLRQLTVVDRGMADFSSNDYLWFSSCPTHRLIYLDLLLKRYGEVPSQHRIGCMGSRGSRLLDGNSVEAEYVERVISEFHNAQRCLLFNSAMDANMGILSCVPQAGDVIIYDELIHASVHDGMRLSRAARSIPFAHNQVHDTSSNNEGQDSTSLKHGSLEKVLLDLEGETEAESQQATTGTPRQIFIVVEGVYSMDGDVAPLVDIVECVERTLGERKGNAHIIVDEAHAVGVIGNRGRGLVNHLGLENHVWARVLGFGKAIGSSGGAVLCSKTTRDYLINYARPLIYSTMMPFPSVLLTYVAYEVLRTGDADRQLAWLRTLIGYTHDLLKRIYNRLPQKTGLFRLHAVPLTRRMSLSVEQVEKVMTPIIPVLTSRPHSLASYCQQSGFMVRPIVAPTVPKGQERIRICIHAGNTGEEIKGLVLKIQEWVLGQLAQGNGGEGGEMQVDVPKL